jgi:hypothetical protein
VFHSGQRRASVRIAQIASDEEWMHADATKDFTGDPPCDAGLGFNWQRTRAYQTVADKSRRNWKAKMDGFSNRRVYNPTADDENP